MPNKKTEELINEAIKFEKCTAASIRMTDEQNDLKLVNQNVDKKAPESESHNKKTDFKSRLTTKTLSSPKNFNQFLLNPPPSSNKFVPKKESRRMISPGGPVDKSKYLSKGSSANSRTRPSSGNQP